MNTSIINIRNLCRTCLIENFDEMQSIYDFINVGIGSFLVDPNEQENPLMTGKKQLSHMLDIITSTTVSQSDNLPTNICRKCAQNVKQFYDFKIQCETSFAKLKTILNQNIEKKIIDDDGHNIEVEDVDRPMNLDKTCYACKTKFTTIANLKRHLKKVHRLRSGSPPELTNHIADIITVWECINCGKICKNEIEAKKHSCNLNKIVSHDMFTKSGDADHIIYEMSEQDVEMKTKLNNVESKLPLSLSSKYIQTITPISESKSPKTTKNNISLDEGDMELGGIKLRSDTLISDNKAKKGILDTKIFENGDENAREMHTIADDTPLPMGLGMRTTSQSFSASNQPRMYISCNVCRYTCIDEESFVQHTKKCPANLENKKYICSICNAVFKEKYGLLSHMVIHSDDRPFVCTICKKSFKRSSNLKEHKLLHNTDRLTCTICDIKFESIKHLTIHNREQHTATEKFIICDICSRGFRQLSELKTHIKIHSGMHLNKCKFCTATFTTKQEKNEHMRKLHINEMRPFLCSQCGARCGSKAQYKDHIHRHAGVKPYQCKFCNKAFTRNNELTIHERYHTDEKSYICTICGKGFFRRSSLTIHTRTHTGERPYKCTFCPNSYTQIQVLKTHLRRHTGEQFICDICGNGYIERHLLSQHKRNVHGLNVTAKTGRLEKFRQSSN